ncbi:hypothetical protein X275_07065 [Marinitoga sp. 1197]|nr:hypothetical protein X275_07065 [Marinitoga sp. 1197]KLO24677.1 hypothetical protein X274_02920 [Marinitoga sp. 1155]NUU98845.1 hypothetical protein [Marinitoga sp. 1154]
MKFPTGGESPRALINAIKVDLVKFQSRQLKSGWEENKGIYLDLLFVYYSDISIDIYANSNKKSCPGEIQGNFVIGRRIYG